MEVSFTPELEAKLAELAGRVGVPAYDLVHDVMASYMERVAEIQDSLDSRYDELKAGRVELIDGEQVRRELKAKTQAERERR